MFLRSRYLFSLYINDLQHILKVEGDNDRKDKGYRLQCFFHVEDLQIYLRVSINQLESGGAALSRVANRAYVLAEAAALKLDASKTKTIICGSKEFVALVVTLDLKFTWKAHVESVTRKVNHALHSLIFFRYSTTFELRQRLVSALAHSS